MAATFDFKERLGAGHFGEVWRVVDTGLNAERALKVIPSSKVLYPANFFHEAQTLKAVEHPNIVKVEETGELPGNRIYVAMEYLPKGSLEDEAKGTGIELTRAKRLMVDVLRGLDHAHNRGILHRDIKPANILIGNSLEGKLSDFGLAISVGMNLKALGVKEYAYLLHMAPEIHDGNPHSVASDIYACGVTLYRIINGDTYLSTPPPPELADQVRNGEFPDRGSYRDYVPLSLRRIVNRALSPDPRSRFKSATNMRRALEQITIEKNWTERRLANGREWVCGWNNKCYEVRCEQTSNGDWEVSVRKGPSRKKLRKVTKLCSKGLQAVNAQRCARRILQDFVLGKLA